jgi:hypothetical protein
MAKRNFENLPHATPQRRNVKSISKSKPRFKGFDIVASLRRRVRYGFEFASRSGFSRQAKNSVV